MDHLEDLGKVIMLIIHLLKLRKKLSEIVQIINKLYTYYRL